jgi:hypothetical protein
MNMLNLEKNLTTAEMLAGQCVAALCYEIKLPYELLTEVQEGNTICSGKVALPPASCQN